MPLYKIISEEALEKLVCSNCNKYLSYGKPKIGSDKIICSRCNQDDGILPLFNENIENYLFPCTNRFDNCKELLHYSQVEEHEKICVNNSKHSCPECEYEGNGCQLYHHFIKKHSNHVLKYPKFNIYLLEEKSWNYLYRINNNLFLVTYEIVKTKCLLKLCMKSIGHRNEMPSCQITLQSLTKKEPYITSEYETVVNMELDILKYIDQHKENSVTCAADVKISIDLFTFKQMDTSTLLNTKQQLQRFRFLNKRNELKTIQKDNQLEQITNALYQNLFPKLICSNCACYVISPIYKCPSNHAQCENCHSSFCNTCDDIVNLSRAKDLEMFHKIIPMPCRWKCKNTFLASELRAHEKVCTERKYKCVEVWCSWNGCLDELIRHWHSETPIYSNTHEVYGYHESSLEFYLNFNCEIFYCRMEGLRANGRNIHIRKISEISRHTEVYSAEVLLTHKCDEAVRQKNVLVKIGGITLLERSVFNYFGQCKNYKIIFSILVNS